MENNSTHITAKDIYNAIIKGKEEGVSQLESCNNNAFDMQLRFLMFKGLQSDIWHHFDKSHFEDGKFKDSKSNDGVKDLALALILNHAATIRMARILLKDQEQHISSIKEHYNQMSASEQNDFPTPEKYAEKLQSTATETTSRDVKFVLKKLARDDSEYEQLEEAASAINKPAAIVRKLAA